MPNKPSKRTVELGRRGDKRPLIVAHRGGSLEAPENTLAALKHGIAVGSDWQEVDVVLSRDDQVVIIHDDTLERTTSGVGAVEKHSLEQLALLTAGAPSWSDEHIVMLQGLGVDELPSFGEGYEAERVPTLEDALRLPNVRLMIEMKTVARPEMLARVVLEVVHKARAENRVILASFDAAVLAAAHKADPTMPLMGLAETADELRTMLTLPIDAVGVKTTLASEALDTAPKHMPVWVWTIYTSAGADEMIRLGVQGLITDVPKRLVRHVGQAASL